MDCISCCTGSRQSIHVLQRHRARFVVKPHGMRSIHPLEDDPSRRHHGRTRGRFPDHRNGKTPPFRPKKHAIAVPLAFLT